VLWGLKASGGVLAGHKEGKPLLRENRRQSTIRESHEAVKLGEGGKVKVKQNGGDSTTQMGVDVQAEK